MHVVNPFGDTGQINVSETPLFGDSNKIEKFFSVIIQLDGQSRVVGSSALQSYKNTTDKNDY